MNWILLTILAALFYGTYNVFIKVSSGHINQIAGAVILQIVAAFVGGLILLFLRMTNSPLFISQKGVTYAILAGVAVGLAEITSFYVFSKGINVTVGIPIIVGGSVLVGAILGLTFLGETPSPIHYLGIIIIIAGIVILTIK